MTRLVVSGRDRQKNANINIFVCQRCCFCDIFKLEVDMCVEMCVVISLINHIICVPLTLLFVDM